MIKDENESSNTYIYIYPRGQIKNFINMTKYIPVGKIPVGQIYVHPILEQGYMNGAIVFSLINRAHMNNAKFTLDKHYKTYSKACATSEDSDQPVYPCSLIRVFADRMCLLPRLLNK